MSESMGVVEFLDNIMFIWDDRCDIVPKSLLISYMEKLSLPGRGGWVGIREVLARYMDSEDESLRRAVAKCLGFVCDDDLSLLEKLLSDSDVLVRCEALESMVKAAGAKVADRVVEISGTDEDPLVRLIAVRQLAAIEGIDRTDVFIKALESNYDEIYAEGCKYLAGKKNRKIYQLLRKKYIRTDNKFDRLCLCYALFFHGERDKLKKIFSALNLQGQDNFYVRFYAARFLDDIYFESNCKIRKLILEKLKEALVEEKNVNIVYEIKIGIDRMEGRADAEASPA
jgi:hypothetical protein